MELTIFELCALKWCAWEIDVSRWNMWRKKIVSNFLRIDLKLILTLASAMNPRSICKLSYRRQFWFIRILEGKKKTNKNAWNSKFVSIYINLSKNSDLIRPFTSKILSALLTNVKRIDSDMNGRQGRGKFFFSRIVNAWFIFCFFL